MQKLKLFKTEIKKSKNAETTRGHSEGQDTPDAIRQRIKQSMKGNFKRYVDQMTQNVITRLNIWKI